MTNHANPPAVVLVPGKSIGPLSLGMSRAEIATAGFELKPHPSGKMGPDVGVAEPYDVVFDQNRVSSIAVALIKAPSGIAVGDHIIPPSASIEEAARAIPRCGSVDRREGGSVISCDGGRTLIKESDGQVEIQVVWPGF